MPQILRGDFRIKGRPQPERRRILMAFQLLLLRLARLGYPVQPDYATLPPSLVSLFQYLHVGRPSYGPGRG